MITASLRKNCGLEKLTIPAPVIRRIGVQDIRGDKQPFYVVGLVDTGSDGTYVPATIPELFGLKHVRETPTRFADRSIPRIRYKVYHLRLIIPGTGIVDVAASGWAEESIVLGRDALMSMFLSFDGDRSRWAMGRTRFARFLLRPWWFRFAKWTPSDDGVF